MDYAHSSSTLALAEEHLDSNFEANPSKGLKDVRKNLLSSYFSEATRAISGEQQSGLSTNNEGAFQKRKIDDIEEHVPASASANPNCNAANSLEDCSGGHAVFELDARIPKFQGDHASATRAAARPPSPTTLCEGEDDPLIIHGGHADGGAEVDLARYAYAGTHI